MVIHPEAIFHNKDNLERTNDLIAALREVVDAHSGSHVSEDQHPARVIPASLPRSRLGIRRITATPSSLICTQG